MLKKLLSVSLLAYSVGAYAGESFTAYCPNFNKAIVHFESHKNNNQAEIVFSNGKFSLFDTDEGVYKTSVRTIYKTSRVEGMNKYSMHFSVYPNLDTVVLGIFKDGNVIGQDSCKLVHKEKI